jgi:hypothetical protein
MDQSAAELRRESILGSTYEQHVERYLTEVKPRLLCFDHYGLMKDGSMHTMYFENFEIIRRQGLLHATPFGFIFLATPHGAFRNPTEIDLRWQVFNGLAYGARAIFYFTYWTPAPDGANTFHNGIIEQNGTRTEHYEMAKRINAEVRAWAPTLMQLTSTGVYHTGVIPAGCHALADVAGVKLVGNASLVIGTFRHADGADWLIIVNRDFKEIASPTLEFLRPTPALQELSSADGRLLWTKMKSGGFPPATSAGRGEAAEAWQEGVGADRAIADCGLERAFSLLTQSHRSRAGPKGQLICTSPMSSQSAPVFP